MEQNSMMKLKDVNPEKMYNTAEICVMLDMCRSTAIRRFIDGSIPAVRYGRNYKVIGQDLLNYVVKCKVGALE